MATKVNHILCVLCGAVVLLVSCIPAFKHAPAGEKYRDSALLGTWCRVAEDGDGEHLSIFPRRDKLVDVVYVYDVNSETQIDGANVLVMEGYSIRLGKEEYLCTRYRSKEMQKGQDEMSVLIFHYIAGKGELEIGLLSSKKFIDLINAGRLEGEVVREDVKNQQYFDQVTVSSSSEKLATVLVEEGPDALVGETLKFSKLEAGR